MTIKHDIQIGVRVLYMIEHKYLNPTRIYNDMKNAGLGMRKQNFFILFKNLFDREKREGGIRPNTYNGKHQFLNDIKKFMRDHWKMSGRNFKVYFFVVFRRDEEYREFLKTNDFLSYGLNNIYDYQRIMGNLNPDNIVLDQSCFMTNEGKNVTKEQVEAYFKFGEWF